MEYIAGLPIPLDENNKARTAYYYNAPYSGYWFLNKRYQRLHLRRYLPENAEDLKCFIIYLHGYGAHVNSTTIRNYGERLSKEGIGVFMFDYVGHGFSDGDRAFIQNYLHWIQDAEQLLHMIAIVGCDVSESEAFFGIDTTTWRSALKAAKFAVVGQSLGGGLAIQLCRRIFYHKVMRFIGNTPHPALLFILKFMVARFFPMVLIPGALERVQIPALIWLRDEDTIRAKLDQWGRPGGLGWGHNMRFGTGLQLVLLTEDIRANLEEVNFPFLVVHDPDDRIVLLAERSKTPKNVHRGMEIKELKGMKHDLLSNAGETLIDITTEWLFDRLKYME